MSESWIKQAQEVLELEAQSLHKLSENLDDSFVQAVKLILDTDAKVVVSGIGKSGQVGQKISSTLSSTGTPSFFVHPSESSHGDLGSISNNDVVIGLSHSGESKEMEHLLSYIVKNDIPLIAITSNLNSSLAKAARVVLKTHVDKEACPIGMAPTISSTTSLALGDALAMTLMRARDFGENEFAKFHPGGRLGRRLNTQVKDIMHKGDAVPTVSGEASFKSIVAVMTPEKARGVVGVVDSKGNLAGIITDGVLRRHLDRSENPLSVTAKEIMTLNPKSIDLNELVAKAQFVMEQFQILTLFVVDKDSSSPQKPVGLIHLHDLLAIV